MRNTTLLKIENKQKDLEELKKKGYWVIFKPEKGCIASISIHDVNKGKLIYFTYGNAADLLVKVDAIVEFLNGGLLSINENNYINKETSIVG